ncbi:MAG: hypothetical protein IT469_06840 [Pseudomonadales bacterium]|nr:hypothetical protein [Pseudomonadales bacterium]
MAAFMVTLQVNPLVDAHPLQLPNVELLPTAAVRVTAVFSGNEALQVAAQLVMPAGLLLTVPLPAPFLVTVRVKLPAGGGSPPPAGRHPDCTVALISPLAAMVAPPVAEQLMLVVPSLRLKFTAQAVRAVPASSAASTSVEGVAVRRMDILLWWAKRAGHQWCRQALSADAGPRRTIITETGPG